MTHSKTLPADLCSQIQSTADFIGKPRYVARMRDGSFVISDNLDCTRGSQQNWVFNPSTITETS